MKKLLLVAVLATLAFVGCKKQSELEFNDMKTATVYVTVNYNPGEHEVNGVIVNDNLPYAEAQVVAKINYSEYSDEAVGVKQVEATNLGEGKYEVKVPAGQKPINAQIFVRGFKADYYETSDRTVEAFYECEPVAVAGLLKDDVRSVAITMYKTSSATNNEITKELKVSGYIKAVTEELVYVDNTLTGNDLIAESNIQRLEQKYVGTACAFELELSNTNDDRTLTYTFNCESNGSFSQTVKYYDSWEINATRVTIKPVSYVANFTHRYLLYNETDNVYRAATQSINGYYSNPMGKTQNANSGDLLLGMNIGDVNLGYTAENVDVINGHGSNTGEVINGHNQYKPIVGGLW